MRYADIDIAAEKGQQQQGQQQARIHPHALVDELDNPQLDQQDDEGEEHKQRDEKRWCDRQVVHVLVASGESEEAEGHIRKQSFKLYDFFLPYWFCRLN